MATFSHLPTELLTHILRLSNEAKSAGDRQRARFSFALISRACFLATADATDFHVAGERFAKALLIKLEREKDWAAQDERKAGRPGGPSPGRSTLGVTRISNIRRLSLGVDKNMNQEVFIDLLRATSSLVALDLVSETGLQSSFRITEPLVVAIGGLAGLRELHIVTWHLDRDVCLRLLIPLLALEVLSLQVIQYLPDATVNTTLLDDLSLPNMRKLEIALGSWEVQPFPNALLKTLATHSTTGIQGLDLESTDYKLISPETIEPLVPLVAGLVRLTWVAPLARTLPLPMDKRHAVLALLGAMSALESLAISMWLNVDDYINHKSYYASYHTQKMDCTLFGTLATLPSLRDVKLTVGGNLSEEHITSYIESHRALESLHIDDFAGDGWTREKRETVRGAAEQARVAFSYRYNKKVGSF
ncbi:hypothetical protein RQP46_003410 [Phenoliferia psychrophenolica]